MYRISRKQVESYFAEVFCPAMGFRVAKSFGDVGAYQLDYAGIYGGFSIERIENTGGGVSNPLGMARHMSAAMLDMLRFAVDCKHNAK